MHPFALTGGPGIGVFPSEFEATVFNRSGSNRLAGDVMALRLDGVNAAITVPTVLGVGQTAGGVGVTTSIFANIEDVLQDDTVNGDGDALVQQLCVLRENINDGSTGSVVFSGLVRASLAGATAVGDPLYARTTLQTLAITPATTGRGIKICGIAMEVTAGAGTALVWFHGMGAGWGSDSLNLT